MSKTAEAVVIENYVKLFVETKVGEGVSLEFSTGCVYVKPTKKRGSTTLGAFWARVVQAYFSVPEFTYKRSYCKAHGSEVLTTVADSYTIHIYLKTGLLTVEGDVVYEWFKVIFRKMIQHYDRSAHSDSGVDYFNDQRIFDFRKETQRKEKRELFHDMTRPPTVDERLAFVASDVRSPELDSRFIDDCYETSADSTLQLVPSDVSASQGNVSMSLKDGRTYIYPLWKQMLNKWLSTDGCRVYICSKHVDAERFKVLTTIAYKFRLNDGLKAVYTDAIGANGVRMMTVKDELMKGCTADEQLFAEYRVFNATKYATTKTISCNFIAGSYPNGTVEMMVTSASFDSNGLDTRSHLHTVILSSVTLDEFQSNFIDPLATV